jgi:hypothetical protein
MSFLGYNITIISHKGGRAMVNQEQMLTEMAILNEKIESFEQLLKSKSSNKGDYHQYVCKKLAEYKQQYSKMTSNYSDLFSDAEVPQFDNQMDSAS